MMNVINENEAVPIKIWTNDIEEEALNQAKNLARLPFLARNGVALMPDVHAGKGSTIGSVIATKNAIIPAAVGVDIGCGMCAVKTSLTASDLPDTLNVIRHSIERDIPLGAGGMHMSNSRFYLSNARAFKDIPESVKVVNAMAMEKATSQVGTLGSGNHFIEICLDENQNVWIMLHSGSRGIGNQVGTYYIEKAKEEMKRWFVNLPDKDLAYLPEGSKYFKDYVEAVHWAQDYAFANRQMMLERVISVLRHHLKEFTLMSEAISCHHNYVAIENHFNENLYITRKGAIRARTDDLGIIPGSMGQRSYIVKGKGNHNSYCSCSHGAGRRMSRTAAKKAFTVDDLIKQTEGVECRKDEAVLDEIPGAYKDIDAVMNNQRDLVEVVHTLKQVMCIKGA